MHICLPDTREVKPQHGSAYLLYNVHIDGLYHCSLRYKQLLHLHQAISKKFAPHLSQLPTFPPKKLLPMSVNQIEDRRQQLEKYLQNISQDKAISNSSIFNLFLLEAQRESTRIRQDQAHLDIELVNGQKIRLQVFTHDSADSVLTAVCRALGLNDRYHAYFCLCLCGYDVIRDKLIIKRRLSFFESPYVTLQMAILHQEQLHNMLMASNSSNGNQCNCYLTTPTTSTNNNQQQLTAVAVAAAANMAAGAMTNNNCQCLSCLNPQQHQSSGVISATTSNDGPLVGSSSSSLGNNNNVYVSDNRLGHYNNIEQDSGGSGLSYNNYTNPTSSNSNRTFYYPSHQSQHHYQHQSINQTPTVSTTSFVTHRILLRKSYWDPVYDTYILSDQQALNLLFIQTVYDIKHSLMFVDRETYHKLESLLASDSKLEYILLARTLKYYNYVHFEPCISDYPRPRTKVMISIGSKELNMRVLKSPRSITRGATSATTRPANGTNTNTNSLLSQSSSSSSSTTTSASTTSISASSSPSSSASADVLSSSSASSSGSTSNTNNQHTTSKTATKNSSSSTNQQVKEPSDQILYCTSSMVPSGYRHLITKDDLVEEEYNFKVPLIRCWRLTSLETLNSNNQPATTTDFHPQTNAPTSNIIRKLSLFNSLSISSSSSNNNNNNNNNSDINNNSNNNLPSNGQQHHRNQNHGAGGIRNNLIGGGSGGSSLLAALVGSANGFHRISLPQQQQQQQQRQQHNAGRNQTADCQIGGDSHRCPSQATTVQPFSQYELSFEYLISKDTLRWITISSDQAIFISISLQGVVDELVSKRDGKSSLYQNPSPTNLVDCPANLSNSINSANNQQQQSFTYLYRDGRQKALNTNNQQLIDKFGTTLGYSPTNPSVLALARQRQQVLRANSSGGLLSTGSRFSFRGSSTAPDTNLHSSLEISHLKKAPSPIINDAFEGVTNDDDL